MLYVSLNPNPLEILARNLPESSKILQCTFGNMPLHVHVHVHVSSKCTMHFRWYFIFSAYGLHFLPFDEVKVPVSISGEFYPKGPLDDFGGFGVVRVKELHNVWMYINWEWCILQMSESIIHAVAILVYIYMYPHVSDIQETCVQNTM